MSLPKRFLPAANPRALELKMKRSLWLIFILMLVTLTACDEDGELRIRNRTAAELYVSVDNSASHTLSAWANWSRYFDNDGTVTVSYAGNYVFPNTTTREIRKNLVAYLDVEPDGGAISILNDESSTLTEVFMSPAGEPNWGDNDLSGGLAPGDSTLWTVTQGAWDLRVVDANLTTYFKYNQPVLDNETLSLSLSGFDSKEAKPKESINSITTTHFRTAQQR